MTHILIALPVYGGSMKAGTAESLMLLQREFYAKHIQFQHQMLNFSDIVLSRNYFGTLMLANRQFTHLLFVDNDMIFSPTVITKLLSEGRPIVGCAYPQRSINLEK